MPDHPPSHRQRFNSLVSGLASSLSRLKSSHALLAVGSGAGLALLGTWAAGVQHKLQPAWSAALASAWPATALPSSGPGYSTLGWTFSIWALVAWTLWKATSRPASTRGLAVLGPTAGIAVLGLSAVGQGFSAAQIEPVWPLSALVGGLAGRWALEAWSEWAAGRRTLAQQRASDSLGKAKAEYLEQITSELRVTVNAVLGVADLIAEDSADAHRRQKLAVFRRAADSLNQTLEDVNELARAQSGQLALTMSDLALLPLIHDQVSQVRQEAELKGVQIHLSVASETPRCVRGDARRLAQVIAHMLNHSVRSTRQGNIHLELRPHARDSRLVRFVVTDTSMSPMSGKLAALVAPFADATHERARHSTGIGLSLAQRLAELMGGKLNVRHSPGRGSIMILTALLPHAVASATTVAAPHAAPALASGSAAPSAQQSTPVLRPIQALSLNLANSGTKNVLLVDDNPSTRSLIESMLDKDLFRVVSCANGREALQALHIAPYDVVLMDVYMPEMDGMAAVRQLRALESERRLRHTPVIALGDAPFNLERQRCLAAGFDQHLSKPLRKSRLLESIAMLVSTPKASAAQTPAQPVAPASHNGQRYMQRDALSLLAHDGVVDVAAAIESLGGNASIYLEAIEQLTPALYNWPARFRDTLVRGETERARQMALDMQSILDVVRASPCAAALGRLATALAQQPADAGAQSRSLAELDRQMQALLQALRNAVDRLREGRNDLADLERRQNSAL